MDKISYCRVCNKKQVFTYSGTQKKCSCQNCGTQHIIDKNRIMVIKE